MMTTQRCVWVVIPTWNRCDDLLACLDSLKKTNISPLNILVVDNASEDNTANAIANRFTDVRLIELSKNIGAAAASNIGFQYALKKGADYILRLDSDTVVDPDFLKPLIEVAESNPSIAIVSPRINYFDRPNEIWYAGADAHPWHFGAINNLNNKNKLPINNLSRFVDYAWGAAMLIKREALETTNGFDPDFFIYYEEVDFCLRLQELGFKIYYLADSVIWHKVGTQNPTEWSAYHWNLSKILLYRKHARSKIHLNMLIIYAFIYAIITHFLVITRVKHNNSNQGPLQSAFKGLQAGMKYQLSSAMEN